MVAVAMLASCGGGSTKAKGPTQAELLRADRVIKWQAHAQSTLDGLKQAADDVLATTMKSTVGEYETACNGLRDTTTTADELDQVPDRVLQAQWAKTAKAYDHAFADCATAQSFPGAGYFEKSMRSAKAANADLATFERSLRALPQ